MLKPVMRVFKQVGRLRLTAHLFLPAASSAEPPRPAVAFFHGGGWVDGTPLWGYPWCQHFFERDLVAVSFAYRLVDQQTVTPLEAIQDARSALRWLRAHAVELGINPRQVIASGFSAGGYLAASTALLEDCDDPGDDLRISACPDALVLISTPVEICDNPWFTELLDGRLPCQDVSPARHVRPGLPPSLLVHAGRDDMVAYASVAAFAGQMSQAGNRCELISYPDEDHFLGGPESYTRRVILGQIDEFFVSLGYLTL